MQPLLSDADLAKLASSKAKDIETLPYEADAFFTEVAGMADLAKAKSILEVGSAILEKMGDVATCVPFDRLDAAPSADLVVSFRAINDIPLEQCDALLEQIGAKVGRHAFFVLKLNGWADKAVERQFWLSRISKFLGIDSVESTEHETLILARNKELCGQIIGKGAMEDARSDHMESAYVSGHPPLDELPEHGAVLHIACYGPSLQDTLEGMRGQHVMSTSGAHDLLISQSIYPRWHAESDPRAERAAFGKPNQRVQYLIASCCHPTLYEALKGFDVRVWHNYNGDKYDAMRDKIGGFQVQAGSVTGLAAIVLGYALGYRKFEIHGMDCSYRGDARHAGAHPGKVQKRMTVKVGDPVNGQEFQTSGQMISAAREFLHLRQRMSDCTFVVHGSGLLQTMLAHADDQRRAA